MSFKLTTTAGALLGLLGSVSGAVRRNSTVPVLNNVMMKGVDGRVSLTGSNLEVEVTATREIGTYSGAIDTTVDARKLQSILETITSSEELQMSTMANDRVQLKGASGRFVFATLPAADFPLVAKPDVFTRTVTVKQSQLRSLIERLAFAMAINEVRYYLNGMMFKLDGDKLIATATNGHHLAVDEIELETTIGDACSVIVPRYTVSDLKRHLSTGDGLVTLEFSSSQMRAYFGNVTYVSKLVEGKFPDHRHIALPTSAVAIAERETLLLACQRTQILSAEKLPGVRLTMARDLGGTMLRIETRNACHEEADVCMGLEYDGPLMDVGLNVSYLIDALQSLNDKNILLQFSNGAGATLLSSPSRTAFKYILMPMRV